MENKEVDQQVNAMYQNNDDGRSESSDHDTDTNSDLNMNCPPDSNYNDANAEVLRALKGDDRGVFWWKLVVKVMMICVAILLTTMTYVQLSQSEANDFEASFGLYSGTLLSYAKYELQTLAESLEAMSASITAHGLHIIEETPEISWPYVTLHSDEFAASAEHDTSFSYNHFVWTSPIVSDIDAWNAYNAAIFNGSEIPISPYMFSYEEVIGKVPVNGTGPFVPIHQSYDENVVPSSINITMNNYDTASDPSLGKFTSFVSNLRHSALTGLLPLTFLRDSYPDIFDASEPLSIYIEPIFISFEDKSEIVGYIQSLFEWNFFFSNLSDEGIDIVCVVENTCGDQFAYVIRNNSATHISNDNARTERFDDISATTVIELNDIPDDTLEIAKDSGFCRFTIKIYPTQESRNAFKSNAVLYTLVVGIVMLSMVASFFAYDSFVQRRNEKVVKAAVRSTAIVSSMFPTNVRDRLYKDIEENEKKQKLHGNLKTYLRDSNGAQLLRTDVKTSPLADLFAETTVLFADIAGFTAWSSVREPYQVFTLLETLYAAFDAIAKQRRIFKVETIGDCYVAVSGLPEPRSDHAVVMGKFASDIMKTMHKVTKDLETTLGPDTGDLVLRIGLHSGPVTAGVLRGERARFQLFGDTMNTAARMEQTGIKNKIQISQATADCLVAGGKSHWLCLREEKIIAKGKGELVTYWLQVKASTNGPKSSCSSASGDDTSNNSATETENICQNPLKQHSRKSKKLFMDKFDRLIDWNADNLLRFLQQISDFRQSNVFESKAKDDVSSVENFCKANPFDEVKEIIALPQVKKSKIVAADALIPVSVIVIKQLRDYVARIAYMYNDNHFHSFDHASHVTMSVSKLLSRIVAPSDVLDDYRDRANKDLVSTLHDHTYGITSDPLTQFACVFSALIHDVDHAGVSNTQLVNENVELASKYGFKSVAEQNSIDLAWELLMSDEYIELRDAICATKSELARFRQLVVNAVMATDIMDKDLKNIRNMRWSKAFAEEPTDGSQAILSHQEKLDQVNRKATIVIEHMIQASDVSHTMQHWHIYRKWNELFYFECYDAYAKGRSMVDPTDTWYQGELDFYDYYIIPLAKKLKECGVFGVSSTEYLQYAMSNRSEWQSRGKEIVAEMKDRVLAVMILKDMETEGKEQTC